MGELNKFIITAGDGPYGNPERYAPGENEGEYTYGAWERAIDLYRTFYTHFVEVSC